MVSNEIESILFFVSNNDAVKRKALRKTGRRVVLDYFYRIRVDKLNELNGMIAQLEHMEKEKAKK